MKKFLLLNTNVGEGIASHLSQFRSPVYGIAALLIILFHAMGPVKEYWLSFFKYGYIGVDMYLMIGAFCLCYSFKRHSLKQFYINRFYAFIRFGFLYVIFVQFTCCYLEAM